MLRKPLLVHSKVVNICCQLFPVLSQLDLVQFLVSQNIYNISLFVKGLRLRLEKCFVLTLHLRKVLFYMCLHLLRFLQHCTSQQSIVLIRQYLLCIFHFFTAQMQVSQKISGKNVHLSQKVFLLLPNIDKVASQALKT